MNKLYIDDIRTPPDDDYIVIRTYDEVIDYLENNKFPDFISFDHDLGEEKTGYDIAKWIVEYDLDNDVIPKDFKFFVHSANPVGSRNINKMLNNYLRFKNGNI